MLVLRYTHPQDREYKVPLNFYIAGKEIPLGLILITLMLFGIAIVNLFTKPAATVSGVAFPDCCFSDLNFPRKRIQKEARPNALRARPIQSRAVRRSDSRKCGRKTRQHHCSGEHVPHAPSITWAKPQVRIAPSAGRQKSSCCTCGSFAARRPGEYDLAPDQLFSTIEQLLFTARVLSIAEKEGKPVRLAVVAANDLWEAILRTAGNLESGSIVLGSSAKMPITEQAREIGIAWERMPEPHPARTS